MGLGPIEQGDGCFNGNLTLGLGSEAKSANKSRRCG